MEHTATITNGTTVENVLKHFILGRLPYATPLLTLCIVQRPFVIRMRVVPVRPLHVFARCSFYQ